MTCGACSRSGAPVSTLRPTACGFSSAARSRLNNLDMKDLDIAIVGAGIGGLSAALALRARLPGPRCSSRRRSWRKSARPVADPTAVHGLNWLGLQPVLQARAC